MQTKVVVHRMASWLNCAPTEVASNSFDKFMAIAYRLIYLTIRILLGTILGKQRRNRSFFFQKLHKGNYVNPSFLAKIYIYRFLRIFGKNKTAVVVSIPKYDHKILCPLNEVDYISLSSREEDFLKRFNPLEGDIVIDVGANIGRYSIIGSKKVKDQGKVVSVEANPMVFDILTQNMKLNKLNNVILLNNAVYSEKTKIKFCFSGNADLKNNQYGTIMTEIDNFPTKGFNKFIELNANTIDLILSENNITEKDVRWMKIDVEGAEFEVLKGAKKLLSNSMNLTILVEIHNLSTGNNFYDEITTFLKNYGFVVDYQEHHESGEAHVIFSNKHL